MKFKLTDETKEVRGITFHRIEALKDFGNVTKGDLGGWVQYESNLSQYGKSWVAGNAKVYERAVVHGHAKIYGNARVCGDASVHGYAEVYGDAVIYGRARVSDAKVDSGRVTRDIYGHIT